MLEKLKEFYKNWRLAKAIDFLSKSAVVFSGCCFAAEAAGEFLQPKAAYAEQIKKYESLATKFLDMENNLGVMDENYKNLDNIIDEAKKTINVKKNTKQGKKQILKKIDELLRKRNVVYKPNILLSDFLYPRKLDKEIVDCFEKNNINYLGSAMSADSLACSSSAKKFVKENFERREHISSHLYEDFYLGDCDNFSMVYLAIGKELKLPLHIVKAPGHIFIRWDEDGKHDALNTENPVNRGDFNWETTLGKEQSDEEYAISRKIPEESTGVFFKNLSEKEIMGLQYSNIGNFHHNSDNFEKAIENYTLGLKLSPNYFELYLNRCAAYVELKKSEEALKDCKKAAILYPIDDKAYYFTGRAYEEANNPKVAIENYNRALELNPNYSEAIKHKEALTEKLDLESTIR